MLSRGLGTAIASLSAGYALSLRGVAMDVGATNGPAIEFLPVEATFTWSLIVLGAVAVIGLPAALRIRPKRLWAEGR